MPIRFYLTKIRYYREYLMNIDNVRPLMSATCRVGATRAKSHSPSLTYGFTKNEAFPFLVTILRE